MTIVERPRKLLSVKIHVLYFAGLRDAIGLNEERIELPAEIRTIASLEAFLAERHSAYAERQAYVRIARNEVFADGAEALEDGDTIALIPPVAGG